MSPKSTQEVWFLTGSQDLYGQETLDLAGILGVDYVRIGNGTDLAELERELRWNDRLAR